MRRRSEIKINSPFHKISDFARNQWRNLYGIPLLKLQLLLLIFTLSEANLTAQDISGNPIPVGHAHNDYLHKKPLFDALKYGYTSIEIDVFAHKEKLKVAHVPLFLKSKKTIGKLYFEPLQKLLEDKSWIYKDYQKPLVLMIDFKTQSEETLQLLRKAIEPYKRLFTYYENGNIVNRPLKLVISGSGFSYYQVKEDLKIYFFKDGSVWDCETDIPSNLVSRGSTAYKNAFSWKGNGEISDKELNQLRVIILKSDDCNKLIRFWAMPQNEKVWQLLLDEGVDWMNIDDLERFATFYSSYKLKH